MPRLAAAAPLCCVVALTLAMANTSTSIQAQQITPSALPLTHHSYEVEAQLDPVQHSLAGSERIRFENTSSKPLSSLYFHLYLNAFRDGHSVFMREGGTRLNGRALGRAGSISITGLHQRDGEDLLPALETELVPGDFTQARVRLATPLQPGAAVELLITFVATLPEIVARAGYAGEFHMLGQWFPKLAKLGDDGSFVSFPYHGFGEFYADFADYTVTLSVPERYRIASGGVLVASSVVGGVRHERYRAAAVHDVVWAAYPYFERVEQRVGAVQLILYGPRGYGLALARQAAVLSAALPFFSEHYGSYPYPALTVIIPPADAQGAGGMEYPTLFTSAGPWWALPQAFPDPVHDVVSVHELAHQWFSGMVASNELAHPMLDEGLAEWSSLDFLRDFYALHAPWTERLGLPDGPFDVLRSAALLRTRQVPSSLSAADKYNERTLAAAVYARPALVLSRIAELVGHERLRSAVGAYARAQRFRHPGPEQLFAVFDAMLGANYGSRGLRKALANEESVSSLPLPAAARTPSSTGYAFLPELWTAAFALLRGLGP